MRQLMSNARCISEAEAKDVFNKLNGISKDVVVSINGLDVEAYYTPSDVSSELEISRICIRVLDVIESVTAHGYSIIH